MALTTGLAQAQTAVAITPPNLAGAVAGSMTGAPAVSPSGAATYSIALAVPPGTAGIAPSLNLEYSSQVGMGLLGQGWSIGGLSAVTRCPKTIVQDGASAALKLAAEDQFCLDGRRLLYVSGSHGTSAEYRTDIDNFSRIRSSGTNAAVGPDSFRVEAKDGTIYTYGSSADATIEAAGKTARHTWSLYRVEDPRGNYYAVSYSENTSTGEFLPTQIRYTGNAAGGLTPYNAVRFIYEVRPDSWQDYIVGSPLTHSQRLTAIRTYVNTATDGSGGALVRDYRIGYRVNSTNERSLVDTIRTCDGAGICLPATQFAWTQRDAGSNNFAAPGSGVWGGPVAVYENPAHKNVWNSVAVVDANGDGKTDMLKSLENGMWQVCLSTGSSFDCQVWAGPNKQMNDIRMGDFNGDGRTDITYAIDTSVGTVCFSTGSSFNCQPTSAPPYRSDSIGDFNGDGRDDFAFCYSQGNGSFSCDNVTTPGGMGVLLEENAICPEEPGLRRNITGDFNGDGKVDYLVINMWSPVCPGGRPHIYSWVHYVIVNGGSQVGWISSSADGLPTVDVNYGRVSPPGSSTGNFNNDTYLDIVLHALTGGKISVCRGTGNGFACTSPAVDASLQDYAVRHVGDFDGDGRADTVHFVSNQARVCQVGGSGSYACTNWAGANGAASMYADFNGDGKTDLAYYNNTTEKWVIGLADGPVPDLLQSVTNGTGHTLRFSYAGLNDASVYTRGSEVSYPKRNINSGATVVSKMQLANAIGGWLTSDYKYAALRTDLQGRGQLGFATVTVVDRVNEVTTTTNYEQSFPYIGMPKSIASMQDNGSVLRATVNTFDSLLTTAGGQHPFLKASTVTTRDLDNSMISTVTSRVNDDGIDSYGNVTSSTETVAAGGDTFTTTTVSTYENRTGSIWLPSLLKTTSVTKTADLPNVPPPPPLLKFTNCTSTTGTSSPVAATMRCTVGNASQTSATAVQYSVPSNTSVSGPSSCAANAISCGVVTVTTSTAPGSYKGTLVATPTPPGNAAAEPIRLTVTATAPALALTECNSTSPTTTPTPATMFCTLENVGQTAASVVTYSAPAGTSATGPSNCSASNSDCGTVTLTTGTAPATYAGVLSAAPTPAGTAGTIPVSLVVKPTPPALTLSSCSSVTPTTSPTQATMTCTLGNTGQTAASSIAYGRPGSTTGSGPTTCAANTANCGAVTVVTSTAPGSYTGSVVATPTPAGSVASASVNLRVNGTPPALTLANCTSVTPTTTPTRATMSCTVGNTGQTAASPISYGTATGTTIAGPASCAGSTSNCGTVTVTTGTAAGTYSGTLTATPNTGSAATKSVSLVVNAAAPAVTSSPSSISFGVVSKGLSSDLFTLTVTNSGNAAATGLSYSVAYTSGTPQNGDYRWSRITCPEEGGSLGAGSSCTIQIYYDAVCTGGQRNGEFRTSGANFSTVVTTLTATTNPSGICH